MNNILDKIIASKKKEVQLAKEEVSFAELENKLDGAYCRSLHEVLSIKDKINIIAELKKASPSKGVINANLDISAYAAKYQACGAAAISVLTEKDYFHGSLDYLSQASTASTLPVLRKDFIFDPYQLLEAKVHQADAVLLICSILTKDEIESFISLAKSYHLECLVEVHEKDELSKALDAGAEMIGINTRNLKDFSIKPETAGKLLSSIPKSVPVVVESGIRNAQDTKGYKAIGINNFLIGEALVAARDLKKTFEELLNA